MATAAPPFLAQRHPPLTLELGSRDDICFLHPGYHISNLLLTLPRVDSIADATPTYGVHHRTALLACQIIAGNTFNNSRFALDRAGQQSVQVPLDGVLTDHEYYFIVDGSGKCSPLSFLLQSILAKSCRSVSHCSQLPRLAVSPQPHPRFLASSHRLLDRYL
jgi:hypothetical protein